MLSSPVRVPSSSVPLVSPTLALSEAGGTCLPASVVLCLALLPSLCAFQGSGGLRETAGLKWGLLEGEGPQPVLLAERGTQVPETAFSRPQVLAGTLAYRVKRSPMVPHCLASS